jgi:hypothetical protein
MAFGRRCIIAVIFLGAVGASIEAVHHPAHRRVLPVHHLHPVLRPAALVGAVAVLRDKTLKTHPAGRPEQVRPDLAAFERVDEDALRAARKQAAFKAGLAKVQRQFAEVVVPSTRMSKAQTWTSSACLLGRKSGSFC